MNKAFSTFRIEIFQFLIKGYPNKEWRKLWINTTFNSSLKDTYSIRENVDAEQQDFQFLIKGYQGVHNPYRRNRWYLSIPH